MHTLQTAPQAARVVDHDEYAVELAIDPKDVVPALIAAITKTVQGRVFLRIAQNPYVSPEQRASDLRRLAELPGVSSALRLLVAPGHAEDLAIALDRESTRPDECAAHDCGAYATNGLHCGRHQ